MPIIFNAIYALLLLIALPYLTWRSYRTGRYRNHLRVKLLGFRSSLVPDSPVWFHGVSLGEVQLLRTIIAAFRRRYPDIPVVVTSTTDNGIAEALRAFPDLPVIAWPFDFSWAVNATLESVRPRLVVLAESELWPNFLYAAQRHRIPVIVVNGRLSPRSIRRIQKVRSFAKFLLYGRIDCFGMQTEDYATNLRKVGISDDRIVVTGNVKYDGATKNPDNPATLKLREQLGLHAGETILIAGSTHDPEEEIALRIYRTLKREFPELRLILVPRSSDRFDAVAKLVDENQLPLMRRGAASLPQSNAIILIDTLGELSAVWGLADIAFVGGSFDGQRGGQSMIEPAGYGVPTVFGPHIWNFRDTVARLTECGGGAKVATPEALENQIREWLKDENMRTKAGQAARAMIESQQGATVKTIELIGEYVLPKCQSIFSVNEQLETDSDL